MYMVRTIVMAFVVLGLTSCGDDENENTAKEAQPETRVVEIWNLKFMPDVITVKPGTVIKWVNKDDFDHDVTSGLSINGPEARNMDETKFPDHKFYSGLFGQGKSFSVTLTKKGEYNYYCNIHPFMVAKIIVK